MKSVGRYVEITTFTERKSKEYLKELDKNEKYPFEDLDK